MLTKSPPRLFAILAFGLLSLLAASDLARARDSVTWLYFSYPPVFIVQGEKVSGIGADIEALLRGRLKQFDHQIVDASPRRMAENLKAGKKFAAIGMVKTQAREAYLHYSRIPCRLGFPPAIQIRRGEEKRFLVAGKVSVAALCKRNDLIWGHSPKASYGRDIDRALAANPGPKNMELVSHANVMAQATRMLVGKRIDWWIADPLVADFLCKTLGLQDRVTYLDPIENRQGWRGGYVVAPRTPWGKRLIALVDAALAEEVLGGRFYGIGAKWVPPSLKPSYRRAYERLIMQAARDYNAARK